jgi:hypothetical protein
MFRTEEIHPSHRVSRLHLDESIYTRRLRSRGNEPVLILDAHAEHSKATLFCRRTRAPRATRTSPFLAPGGLNLENAGKMRHFLDAVFPTGSETVRGDDRKAAWSARRNGGPRRRSCSQTVSAVRATPRTFPDILDFDITLSRALSCLDEASSAGAPFRVLIPRREHVIHPERPSR